MTDVGGRDTPAAEQDPELQLIRGRSQSTGFKMFGPPSVEFQEKVLLSQVTEQLLSSHFLAGRALLVPP